MKVLINDIVYIPQPPTVDEKCKSIASALSIRFSTSIGDNMTIRDYLYCLLSELWRKEEYFSGKRPFGKSDWKYELYAPLIEHGYIQGILECKEDNTFPHDFNKAEADLFIANLIKIIFYSQPQPQPQPQKETTQNDYSMRRMRS